MGKINKDEFKKFLNRNDLCANDFFINDECNEITKLFSESCAKANVVLKVMNDKELQVLLKDIVESDYINFRNIMDSKKETEDAIIFFKNCVDFLEKIDVI